LSYNHVEVKKFLGLFLRPNSFSIPDGAFEILNNCVIIEDDIIKKRSGFKTFNTPSSGTLNNLFLYQDNVLALYNSKIVRLSSLGVETLLTGETVALTDTGRSQEQNNNLYFSSDNGVMKLTAYNSTVSKSGVAPALDLRGNLVTLSSNFLTNGYQVGYRVLFGYKDSNSNVILGAPSDFFYISNTSGSDKGVRLEISVPSEVNSVTFFYQIYRSDLALNADEVISNFKLIKEDNLTSSQVTNGVIYFEDDINVIFQENAAELYTNPNSREGETQANERPPLCKDIALFKEFMFYANCQTKHLLQFSLVSTSSTYINSGDYIEVKQGATERRYVARGGVANDTTLGTVTGTTTMQVTFTAHGLVTGDTVYISGATGGATNITEGVYTITAHAANTFDFTANTGANSTSCYFQGLTNGTYPIFRLLTTGSLATQLDTTARSLVKAINRDASSAVYARYLSSNSDVPAQMLLQSKTFSNNNIQLRANSTTSGAAFSPELPSSFGSSVQSDNANLPNCIYVSKFQESEAVPLVNQIFVGSKNKDILRIFALRDSVIVLKEDGVFRIDGDSLLNFTATLIDNTVFCLVPNTAQLLNGQVYFLSNQGVCAATPTSVERKSLQIDSPIRAILGNPNLVAQTSAIGYESEGFYLLSTLEPLGTTASVVYVYNSITNTWTTWDTTFVNGIVGTNDTLFYISSNNLVKKERKNKNKLDYVDEDFSITINTITDDFYVVLTSTLAIPEQGDTIVNNNVINRIKTVTSLGSNQYSVSFEFEHNLTASLSTSLYEKITSTIKPSPFHAGSTNRMKQFAQFQVHTRDKSITYLEITFANENYGATETTQWRSSNVVSSDGWGNTPFGFFSWGQEDGIDIQYNTQPAPVIRTYVPLFAQRSSYNQPILVHPMGAEAMNIQSWGFQLRGYGERVTI
jgi:hypothetical protein